MSQSFYIFPNQDGTTRWLWPTKSAKPLFLKFYNANTWKQQVFRLSIQLVFLFKLQSLFFKKRQAIPQDIQPEGTNWALFFDSIGAKKVLYTRSKSGEGKFTKIATEAKEVKMIAEENQYLSLLSDQVLSFEHPRLLSEADDAKLKMNEISFSKNHTAWTPKHCLFMRDLSQINSDKGTILDWDQWSVLNSKIENLNQNKKSSQIPANILQKLDILRKEVKTDESYDFSLAHGNFTPWNAFETKQGKLAVINWEQASSFAPKGFDFFHFHIQSSILKRQTSARNTLYKIYETATLKGIFSGEMEMTKYLKVYLLNHISSYSYLYNQLEAWNGKTHCKLTIWNNLLNEVIESQNKRQLFIVDFFEYLKTKNYAALEFTKSQPQNLSEYSDINLFVEKHDLKAIKNWIKTQKIVYKVRSKTTSNCTSLDLLLFDGTFLHINLTVEIKKKNTVYQDITDCIKTAQTNVFGVKECTPRYAALHIGLSFALNQSQIPQQHQAKKSGLLPLKSKLDDLVY